MKTNRRVLLASLAMVGAAIIAVGCCSSGVTSTTSLANFSAATKYAYAANENSNDISGYTVDNSTGELMELATSPFTGPTGPRDAIVEPMGKYLYVSNGGSNGVSGFAINSATGALSPIAGSPFAGGTGPRGITVDCCGRYVYTADRSGNSVSGWVINAGTGALTPISGSPFSLGGGESSFGPQQVTVSPTGRFLYVSNHLTGDISGFTLAAATGTLTLISGSPFTDQSENLGPNIQPFAVVVSPSEKFLYVTNHGQSTLSVYQIDGMTGALTAISGSPFDISLNDEECSANPFGASISPDGRFLFVADNGCDAISVFSLDATTGVPTQTSNSPFFVDAGDCYAGVNEANLDPSGRFLYVANMSCGSLSAFSVDATSGDLSELANSPVNADNGPYGVAIARFPQPQ